jgi:AcrR family transcriptional regulator
MDHVADRLGVTKGTVYFYFPSKEALFEAVINAQIDRAAEDLATHLASLSGSASEKLEAYLSYTYEQIGIDPDAGPMLGLLIKEGPRFPHLLARAHTQMIGPTLAACQTILEEGARSGEFRPEAAAPFAAETILCPGLWLAVSSLLLNPHSKDMALDMLKTNIALMLKGVMGK